MIRLSKAYFRSVEKDLVREGRGRKPIYPYWLIFTLIARSTDFSTIFYRMSRIPIEVLKVFLEYLGKKSLR